MNYRAVYEQVKHVAGAESLLRLAVEQEMAAARKQHERKHRRAPGGLRARVGERKARAQRGYCRHGVYVGGIGIDWMCPICEASDEHWLTSSFSKSERAKWGAA